MFIILFRTALIYVFLIFIMRLMGKRQLGELEVSDLVITLLLSEIATIPITDKNTPLLYALIPVVTLSCLEVFASSLSLHFPRIKAMLSPKPAILIHNGKVNRQEMKKVRISLDELICELRQKDVPDIDQVQYAILESNGKLSVITKSACTPPSAEQLGLAPCENGIMRVVFCDGVYDDATLRALGKNRAWVQKQCKEQGMTPDRVFYLMVDDLDNIRIQRRQE